MRRLLAVLLTVCAAPTMAQQLTVIQLRGLTQMRQEFCRIKTSASNAFPNCQMTSGLRALDKIYLPEKIADRIASHLQQAYEKDFFDELSKKDLFHGHLMARGPQTTYSSPQDFFNDLEMIVYHSHEYDFGYWEDIEGNDPFVPNKKQRSFVGSLKNDSPVKAAIDIIDRTLHSRPYPAHFLRQYKTSGTIYSSEVNESTKVSKHSYRRFGNSEALFMWSDTKRKTPCEIFTQIYIMEEENGRYLSPDGKTYDMVLHCRYKQ